MIFAENGWKQSYFLFFCLEDDQKSAVMMWFVNPNAVVSNCITSVQKQNDHINKNVHKSQGVILFLSILSVMCLTFGLLNVNGRGFKGTRVLWSEIMEQKKPSAGVPPGSLSDQTSEVERGIWGKGQCVDGVNVSIWGSKGRSTTG